MMNTKQIFTVGLGLLLVLAGSLTYTLATDNPRIQLLAVSLGCASPMILLALRQATSARYRIFRITYGAVAAGLIGVSAIGLYNSRAFEFGTRTSVLLTITLFGTLFVALGSRTRPHLASAA